MSISGKGKCVPLRYPSEGYIPLTKGKGTIKGTADRPLPLPLCTLTPYPWRVCVPFGDPYLLLLRDRFAYASTPTGFRLRREVLPTPSCADQLRLKLADLGLIAGSLVHTQSHTIFLQFC